MWIMRRKPQRLTGLKYKPYFYLHIRSLLSTALASPGLRHQTLKVSGVLFLKGSTSPYSACRKTVYL